MNRRLQRKRRKTRSVINLVLIVFTAAVICFSLVKGVQMIFFKDPGLPVLHLEDEAEHPANQKFTVCLDPGHGDFDNGSTSITGVTEKEINLKVALKVGKHLETSDLNVIYTRDRDIMLGTNQKEDLKLRCEVSNNANADIYISIHCNFDKYSADSKGFEIWCRYPNQKGEELALSLEKQLDGIGYTRDRGLKYESDGGLFVLRNTKAPAALVELGFLSHSGDSSYLQSEEGQDKCAQALAQAILDYAAGNQ